MSLKIIIKFLTSDFFIKFTSINNDLERHVTKNILLSDKGFTYLKSKTSIKSYLEKHVSKNN